jgi:hypothetical protein
MQQCTCPAAGEITIRQPPLIGTLRREYLDHLLFWTTTDLENKLLDFRTYFNNHRTHSSREGRTPDTPDQSQISGRLDGSPIVDPYFRPQWLPNF